MKEGGREHDLSFIAESETWLKFTKPSAAGYVISFDSGFPALEPALPLEYLDRLFIQNELFSDTVSFVGIGGERHRPRIVTRQAHIKGEGANSADITLLMDSELGFRQLPPRFSVGYADSLAFAADEFAVFDLRSANVVRTAEGLIVPIDSIPVRLDQRMREILES